MNTLTPEQTQQIFSDFASRVPTSLALKHIMRLVPILKAVGDSGQKILDVGCGDGSFWNAYPNREIHVVHGIDLSAHEAALALRRGVFRRLEIADISRWVPDDRYDIAIGNCSLEHVPDIHSALSNIRTALKPDGRLLLLVPAFGWTKTMRTVQWLQRRSNRLGMAAAGALDGFFQHHHLYDADTWRFVLEKAGYSVLSCKGVGSPVLNEIFERNLPTALLEFVYKAFRHRYSKSTLLRSRLSERAVDSLNAQPVPLSASGIVEYIIEATPALSVGDE